MFSYLYGKVRLKARFHEDSKTKLKTNGDSAEVIHHGDEPAPEDNRTVHPELDEHHSNRGWGEPKQTTTAARGGAQGGGATGVGGAVTEVGGDGGAAALLNTKGV